MFSTLLLTGLFALACGDAPAPTAGPVQVDAEIHPQLLDQAALFEQAVLQPAEGIYVAVGFALSNVIALEGPQGLVIVDTTEGRPAAQEALAAIREHTQAPIKAVVLTHNHADHVFGGQVFVEDAARTGTPDLPIWAHAETEAGIDRIVNVLRDAIQVRSNRMFGVLLPADRSGAGLGFALRFRTQDIALARPTHSFGDRTTLTAAGLTLELVHAPGETDDQLFVWWPQHKALLPADNVYQAFPNLYTIRGTTYRDVRKWVASIDAMRDLQPELLVPQHTRPVVGAAAVAEVLTAYRDAIQFVHDQTVRGMNQGRTPDQLAAEIALPAHLAQHPWLAEHYGRVPWSVRGVYAGSLGWFDGDGAALEPLPPDERARRYAAAFEAGQTLPDQARAALASGENAWAAELARLWTRARPDDDEARQTLASAFEGLARGHINPNAVHWYLTEAAELRGEIVNQPNPPGDAPLDLIDGLPLDAFMGGLASRLRAERTLDTDQRVLFVFTDVEQRWVLHVRGGVAEVRQRELRPGEQADLTITTSARSWKRLAAKKVGAAGLVASGELEIDGGLEPLLGLLRWFET